LKAAKEKKFEISGIKDIDGFINNIKDKLTKRKKYSEVKKEKHNKKEEKSTNEVKKKDESQK